MGVHFPEARISKDGDQWVMWDEGRRRAFIDGYMRGYKRGQTDGCAAAQHVAQKTSPENAPDLMPDCVAAGIGTFSENKRDFYVTRITEFYEQYPSDHEIPLDRIMNLISEKEQRTTAQIHAWYLSLLSQRKP
jgi:hypothetical protein